MWHFSLKSLQIYKSDYETAWACFAVFQYAVDVVRGFEFNALPSEIPLIIFLKLHKVYRFKVDRILNLQKLPETNHCGQCIGPNVDI